MLSDLQSTDEERPMDQQIRVLVVDDEEPHADGRGREPRSGSATSASWRPAAARASG